MVCNEMLNKTSLFYIPAYCNDDDYAKYKNKQIN